MELIVLSQNIKEPVTVDDVKAYMGYPTGDQDALIHHLITTARVWLENRCAISVTEKDYAVYFEKDDRMGNWYELPVSPVVGDIVVLSGGEEVTFSKRGLKKVSISTVGLYRTVLIGEHPSTGIEVRFRAGEKNIVANEIIKRIVSTMFNSREDGGGDEVFEGRLPFDTLRLIESIDQNTGF